MQSKVEAALAGKKSSFPEDMADEKDAMAAAAAAASSSPAAIFAFLASPLSLLRHVGCLCAGYLGLDGGLKPAAPAPAPAPASSSSSSAAVASQIDEVAASDEVVLEVRSRGGNTPPPKPAINFPTKQTTRSLPQQSIKAERGGDHN